MYQTKFDIIYHICTLYNVYCTCKILMNQSLFVKTWLFAWVNKEYIYENSTVCKSKKKLFNRNVTVLNKNQFIFYFILQKLQRS